MEIEPQLQLALGLRLIVAALFGPVLGPNRERPRQRRLDRAYAPSTDSAVTRRIEIVAITNEFFSQLAIGRWENRSANWLKAISWGKNGGG